MPNTEKTELDPKKSEAFIATARERFKQCVEDEKDLRKEALLDLKFVAGEQWDDKEQKQRIDAGRPCLKFPRMHTFVQPISNEARQNKAEIKFIGAGDDDAELAEVYESLARQIQYESNAQVAYETAAEGAAGGGFGFFRFLTDYCDNETNDQELKLVEVPDQFAVYGILKPSIYGKEPDHCFVIETYTKEEYKQAFPKSDIVSLGWDEAGKKAGDWVGDDEIRVAEYWWTETETKKNKYGRSYAQKIIKSCRISGLEVLPDESGESSETEWVGYCIPIVPVLGKKMIVDGKMYLISVIRYQRDPQRLINLYKSRIAETLGTAPIQPYVAVENSLIRPEDWAASNKRNYTVLYHKAKVDGVEVQTPKRQVFEPPIQAYSEAAQQEIDDMKDTTGIFDASRGARSNETSGVALRSRQQQSDITNMHFMDNLGRAFNKGGRIIKEVIESGKVYDTPRIIKILGKDETPKLVKINQQYQENGKPKNYQFGKGKYDIVVTMGRSYSTKRSESYDFMLQLVQANPNLMQMMGDILFKNYDGAGADELAERFKKMLPPELQDEQDDPKAQLSKMQAQLAQTGQQLQAIDAFAAKLQKEQEGKVIENQTKMQIAQMQEQSRLEIVKMQEATKLAVAQITATKDANQAIADRELEQFKILHGSAHEVAMNSVNQGHEAAMAERGHEQAIEQSQMGHEQNLEAQDQAGQQAITQQQMAQESQPAE
jgi:hypothetical protein